MKDTPLVVIREVRMSKSFVLRIPYIVLLIGHLQVDPKFKTISQRRREEGGCNRV